MNGKGCSHNNSNSQKACVSLVPIFNHLEDEQMDEIMQTVQSRSLKKGEIMFHAGDESDALYIINQGRVKIYHLAESGKEQVVRILNPGDFTGELALFQESIHEGYSEALIDTKICMITGADLQSFLMKYPMIALSIMKELTGRLEKSEIQTTRFATEKVETRIVSFLVECMEQGSSHIELPMSRKDLASYLGTTPETISRRFADLEAAGYIVQKGQRKIKIMDLDGLLLL